MFETKQQAIVDRLKMLQETWRILKINEANITHADYLEVGSFRPIYYH